MAPTPDQQPCGLLTTDEAGLILWANQRFCAWLGLQPEALAGRRRWQELLTVGGRIFVQTHFQPLLQMQGSVAELKLDFTDSAGRNLPMVLNAERGLRHGRTVHDMAVFVARDRDRYEREILAGRRRFEQLAAEASRQEEQARDRALFAEQMIGIVSHDLRNPLSAVQLGVRALADKALPDHLQQAVVQRIGRSADRAGRLIAELLDFTAARLGQGLPVAPRPVDLHALVAEVVDDLAPSFGHRLAHRRGEHHGPAQVDPDRLAQLIGNLVANAIHYGAEGHTVTIASAVTPEQASVSVHNHGPAIPEPVQAGLFRPMVRGAAASTQRSVGLGLYIVAEIAKAHGGAVQLRSTPEDGTTFTVRFPAAPPAAPPTA